MELSRQNSQETLLWILVGIICSTLLVTGSLWGVLETSEARYAEISREMFRSGDWVHPQLLGIYHYHKPPLTYWLTCISFSIFGVNTFAVRIPMTIAFFFQLYFVFKLSRQMFQNKRVAQFAVLVYSSLPIVLISARGLTTDVYLTLWILVGLSAWMKFLIFQERRSLYVFSLAVGLSFLTKGPVALIVLVPAVIGFWSLIPNGVVSISDAFICLLIFIFTGLSWYLYLIIEDQRFGDYFFFHHLVDRIGHAEKFSRSEPWYYYLPVIPAISFPWIVPFLAGILQLKKSKEHSDESFPKTIALWWIIIPLIIFSIASSKLPLYILPTFIGFGLICGYYLATRSQKKMRVFVGISISLIYVGLLVAPFIASNLTFTISLRILPIFFFVVTIGIIVIRMTYALFMSLMSSWLAITLIIYAALLFNQHGDEVHSTSGIADFIKEHKLTQREIIVYNELLPSLSFELDKMIVSVYADKRSLQRETQFQKDPHWQTNLININNTAEEMRLQHLFEQKCVVVAKEQLPIDVKNSMASQWRKHHIGGWIVYYN